MSIRINPAPLPLPRGLVDSRAGVELLTLGHVVEPGDGSLVVDPMGVVLAELGEQVGVALADCSRERLAEVRARNPALEHRRFDIPGAERVVG